MLRAPAVASRARRIAGARAWLAVVAAAAYRHSIERRYYRSYQIYS
jgi:hypothetical protein